MSRREGRVLSALLFTDIVGSSAVVEELGDQRWKVLLDQHHRIVRRAIKRFGGRELDAAGDGFFAAFDRPDDAIDAASAIADGVRSLGIEIRAGVHVGQAETVDRKLGGIAVHTAARVMAAAGPGQILVSSTARESMAGSGVGFADRGVHELKGIPGEWHLFEVVAVAGTPRPGPLEDEEARERRAAVSVSADPRRRRRPIMIAAAAVVLVGTVIVIAARSSNESAEPRGSTRPPAGVLALDPTSGKIIGEAKGAFGASHFDPDACRCASVLVAGEGAVWTSGAGGSTIIRIDPDTYGTKEIAFDDPGCFDAIAIESDAVWAECLSSTSAPGHAVRVDIGTLHPTDTIPIPGGLGDGTSFTGSEGSLWASFISGAIVRIRLDTEETTTLTHAADNLAAGDAGVWVASVLESTLTPIDTRTDRPGKPVHLNGNSLTATAVGSSDLWVLDALAQTVTEVDPRTGKVVGSPISVRADTSSQIAFGLGAVYVAGGASGVVTRIDPSTGATALFRIGVPVSGIATDAQHHLLWVLAPPIAPGANGF